MGFQDKITVKKEVVVKLSNTETRDLVYRLTTEGTEKFESYLKDTLGITDEDYRKETVRVVDRARTQINPVVGLAVRTNPASKEKYAEKGRRKEELMAEILQIMKTETDARSAAAAASRKANQAKKAEG
jgi:predicted transcriptional regulator